MTGSVIVGGAIALGEPAVNTVAYVFHELIWTRLREGSRSGEAGLQAAA
ncbi:DUF2061 domain-containing protein [Thiorhodococcus minor]